MNITDLRTEIASEGAQSAFDALVEGFSTLDFTLHPHEQGFHNTLRIHRGDEFCFALAPNDEWVLAYIRKPELRRDRLTSEAVLQAFPDARQTPKGEITLRISDVQTAKQWIEMIRTAG